MSLTSEFHSLSAWIRRKIYLLIGRSILAAVNNSGKTQRLQLSLLKDEVITDVERLQEYGLETYPKTGSAEALTVFVNGNRDQGVVVVVHDRDARPTDLGEGDVVLYNSSGVQVRLADAAGTLTLKTGDASLWKPCIIGNCLFTGAPHGGPPAGIVKLKGE